MATNWPDITSHGKDWKAKRDLSKCFDDNYEQTKWNLKFGDEIGSGAYGVVYRVQRTTRPKVNSEGKVVKGPKTDYIAAKIMNLETYYRYVQPDTAIQCIENMLTDMTALRFINHKNIVKMLDWMSLPDSKTGFPFVAIAIFMELCDGSLEDIVPLPREQSLIWLRQIADAVHYLHKKYIVHNDIADRNILYKYESTRPPMGTAFDLSHVQYMTFKLSDFGLSKEFNETNFP